MSEVSDIEVLLKAAKRHAAIISWMKAGLVAVVTGACAFGGAVWAARGYLDQLATRDQMNALLDGQKKVTDDLEAHVSRLNERIGVIEEHDRGQDRTADILRSDVKELQGRAGVLIRR